MAQLSLPERMGWAEGVSGVYHLTATGQTSWFGFAEAMLNHVPGSATHAPRLTPITTQEYPTPAQRPKNSILSNIRLRQKFGLESPRWEIGLRLSLEENNKEALRKY
jgi:dTDP-4-dehydrorhamnose reductase